MTVVGEIQTERDPIPDRLLSRSASGLLEAIEQSPKAVVVQDKSAWVGIFAAGGLSYKPAAKPPSAPYSNNPACAGRSPAPPASSPCAAARQVTASTRSGRKPTTRRPLHQPDQPTHQDQRRVTYKSVAHPQRIQGNLSEIPTGSPRGFTARRPWDSLLVGAALRRCHPGSDVGVHHLETGPVGNADRHHHLGALGDRRKVRRVQSRGRPQRRGGLG